MQNNGKTIYSNMHIKHVKYKLSMTHNLKIEKDHGHLIVAMFQIKQSKW
jgi:hypothetical protein